MLLYRYIECFVRYASNADYGMGPTKLIWPNLIKPNQEIGKPVFVEIRFIVPVYFFCVFLPYSRKLF
jgi:hypothetical protein